MFETGSVSQPTATIAATLSSVIEKPTLPSVVSRPERLAASAMPFSRSNVRAASRSPPVSSSARLQSIIPAPVWSRSSFTRLAEIVVDIRPPPPPAPRRALRSRRALLLGGRLLGGLFLGGGLLVCGKLLARLFLRRRLRLLRHLGGVDELLAGLDAVGEHLRDERARADGVVVSGNDVVRLVRIGVRVDEADDRNLEALRLPHRELLLLEVDDEHRVGLALHVGHAAEVRLELLELGLHRDPLLRRKQVELPLGLQSAELVQMLDALRERPPVRQQAAQPAVRDVRHADTLRLLRDGVLGLLLRAHEEHGAAAACDVGDERVRLLEQRLRLGEIDDVDAAALAEDEALHLRVPAARLVAEVDAGLQEVLHGHDRHEMCSLRLL